MIITLYEKFSKKLNSTKRPETGTDIECFLKENTSIENPHFILKDISFNVNYVKWGNHYYFVDDIISLKNNLYEIVCNEDVLATYKDDILKLTAFVNFSSSLYNSNILDNRIPTTNDLTVKASSIACEGFSDGGVYCVTCVGNGSANLNRYYLYDVGLNELAKKVVSIDADLVNDIVLQFGNCVNAISNIMFIPFDTLSVFNTTVYLGNYNTDVIAWTTDKKYIIKKVVVDIPWINSNITRRGFETIELYLPFYGTINLNAELFKNDDTLSIVYCMDYVTGGLTYMIGDRYTYSCDCGIPISLGIYQNDVKKTPLALGLKFADYISTGFLNATTKLATGEFGNYSFDISNKTSDVGTNFSTVGNMGGFNGAGLVSYGNNKIYIRNSCHGFSDSIGSLKDICGNPLFKKTSLAKLTGYVQCNGASIDSVALENSRQRLNSFLNSGFFIE